MTLLGEPLLAGPILGDTTLQNLHADACKPPVSLPPEIELFREEHRAECLRIAAENYDRTMALNLDRELSEMFSNSSFPPRFFVLKQGGEVRGFGCYTISWMEYGVFEISWVNVDRRGAAWEPHWSLA